MGCDADIADVAIVGAGAAGLAAAIFAGRANPRRTIVALEGAPRVGAKIRVSGGGRCNVTNSVVNAADFHGGSRNTIKRILAAFPVEETIAFFRDIGVALHEEAGGKLFPDTHDARSVVDALVRESQRVGVRILTSHRVHSLSLWERVGATDRTERIVAQSDDAEQTNQSGFLLSTSQGELHARRVIIATGGLSLPKTGSDGAGYAFATALGHALVPTTPALVPLVLDGDFHTPLSGISQDVEITVRTAGGKPFRIRGALLWTHFGVSGPAALDASRHWHRATLEQHPVELRLSFAPGESLESLEQRWLARAAANPRQQLNNALAELLPARVADAILARLNLATRTPLAHFPRDDRRRLLLALLDWPLPVRDSRGYAVAEVTAGGIALDEIDPATMQSRKCPGLFVIGEILDCEGRLGGFNFQWAWCTGRIAGENA